MIPACSLFPPYTDTFTEGEKKEGNVLFHYFFLIPKYAHVIKGLLDLLLTQILLLCGSSSMFYLLKKGQSCPLLEGAC